MLSVAEISGFHFPSVFETLTNPFNYQADIQDTSCFSFLVKRAFLKFSRELNNVFS